MSNARVQNPADQKTGRSSELFDSVPSGASSQGRRAFLRRAGMATLVSLASASGATDSLWERSAYEAQAAEKDHDFSLGDVIAGAISPSHHYCMGYSNPGASGLGYIVALKLSTGVAETKELDETTAGIVSYDMCERNDAYLGQINLLQASSFCGVNGAVWGYNLARAEKLEAKRLYDQPVQDGKPIPVYDVQPLLDCAVSLFGTAERRRFPLMPGAHVICAYKYKTQNGPGWVWAAIALAIAVDRSTMANLFIEDNGFIEYRGAPADLGENDGDKVNKVLDQTLKNVTNSAIKCGQNQSAKYSKIFAGYVKRWVPKGSNGTALACAPYFLLARDAVPASGPESAIGMTISQWEKAIGVASTRP